MRALFRVSQKATRPRARRAPRPPNVQENRASRRVGSGTRGGGDARVRDAFVIHRRASDRAEPRRGGSAPTPASSVRARACARAKIQGQDTQRRGQTPMRVWGWVGVGAVPPRNETRGVCVASVDAPSLSRETATPGSRDLTRGGARDRVRLRSRRARQPFTPSPGLFLRLRVLCGVFSQANSYRKSASSDFTFIPN